VTGLVEGPDPFSKRLHHRASTSPSPSSSPQRPAASPPCLVPYRSSKGRVRDSSERIRTLNGSRASQRDPAPISAVYAVPTKSLVPARLVTKRVELPVVGTSHVRPRGKQAVVAKREKKARSDRDWWRCRVGNWREVDRKRDRAHTAFACLLRGDVRKRCRETGTQKKKKRRPAIEGSRADDQPMAERMENEKMDVSTTEEVVRAQAR
jgi:hypothetical protein